MVTDRKKDSTPFDFNGKNLTPYGGLLPVITILEKLGFQSLVEQFLTSKPIPAPPAKLISSSWNRWPEPLR